MGLNAALFAALIAAHGGHAAMSVEPAHTKPVRLALTCFKSGEQTSGQNKICYYNCAGSEAAITIAAYQLCPLNINR